MSHELIGGTCIHCGMGAGWIAQHGSSHCVNDRGTQENPVVSQPTTPAIGQPTMSHEIIAGTCIHCQKSAGWIAQHGSSHCVNDRQPTLRMSHEIIAGTCIHCRKSAGWIAQHGLSHCTSGIHRGMQATPVVSQPRPLVIQHCGCGQSLRIPTDQGPLVFTCPKCRAVWNWPPSTERATSPATEYKPPATESMPATNSVGTQSKNNPYAVTSFALGIASVFFFQVGILPLLGIVFGVIGLSTFREPAHKNKWMAAWGLILSIVYMVMNVGFWNQIGTSPSEALSKPAPTVRDSNGEFRLRRRK